MVSSADTETAFHAALGDCVVAWAHLEAALDMLIDGIINGDTEKKYGTRRPRQLGAKLKFLRHAIPDLFEGQEAIEEAFEFCDLVEELGEFRHSIVHGAVASAISHSGEVDLLRFLHRDGRIERNFTQVSIPDIKHHAQIMNVVAHNTLHFIKFAAATPNV